MSYLGIRCSNSDFCYIVLSGSQRTPQVISKKQLLFPKRFSKSQSLKWFLQEIEQILKRHSIHVIAIKGTEGNAPKDKAFVKRIEFETMIFLAAANHDIKRIYRKVKSTMAKDFGFKGRAKYLDIKLDCTIFPGFQQEKPKMKDAILAAWCSMPK